MADFVPATGVNLAFWQAIMDPANAARSPKDIAREVAVANGMTLQSNVDAEATPSLPAMQPDPPHTADNYTNDPQP